MPPRTAAMPVIIRGVPSPHVTGRLSLESESPVTLSLSRAGAWGRGAGRGIQASVRPGPPAVRPRDRAPDRRRLGRVPAIDSAEPPGARPQCPSPRPSAGAAFADGRLWRRPHWRHSVPVSQPGRLADSSWRFRLTQA